MSQRPPPLVVPPYQPLGFRKLRGRARGRRGGGERNRHIITITSSSETELTITRVTRHSRRLIIFISTSSSISTSSGDDEVLTDVKLRSQKYPIGTRMGKNCFGMVR